jgi:hypothetical protein
MYSLFSTFLYLSCMKSLFFYLSGICSLFLYLPQCTLSLFLSVGKYSFYFYFFQTCTSLSLSGTLLSQSQQRNSLTFKLLATLLSYTISSVHIALSLSHQSFTAIHIIYIIFIHIILFILFTLLYHSQSNPWLCFASFTLSLLSISLHHFHIIILQRFTPL